MIAKAESRQEYTKVVDAGQGPYTIVPNTAFDLCKDHAAFHLYCWYRRVCGTKAVGRCWMSLNTISNRLGMRRATVVEARRELEKIGLIEVQYEKTKGKHDKVVVTLLDIWEATEAPVGVVRNVRGSQMGGTECPHRLVRTGYPNENTMKKNTLSPATPGDVARGGFPLPEEEEVLREQTFADVAAWKLYSALAKKRKILRQPVMTKWANKINQFLATGARTKQEFKSLLTWYRKNIGGDHVPLAYSAEAFCQKFVQIEEARARLERPAPTEEDEIIYDPLYIPATKEGRERKARQMARAKVSVPAAKNRNA